MDDKYYMLTRMLNTILFISYLSCLNVYDRFGCVYDVPCLSFFCTLCRSITKPTPDVVTAVSTGTYLLAI